MREALLSRNANQTLGQARIDGAMFELCIGVVGRVCQENVQQRLKRKVLSAREMYGRDLLHCENGAEASLALGNPLIGLRSFSQRVGLDYRLDFSLGHVIEGLV